MEYYVDNWACEWIACRSSLYTPLININRNLRMLNEQAFKALQSQNLLDPQAEKDLNEALDSITDGNNKR
ncbi:hypothetical protein [Helicobacter pylori]|nr:hypothetical protein [Helicobacter pylori]PUB98483.1 hypothetical protein C2S02_07800 [Helicobacter pylori]PUD26217.1 hypothetical protein C2R94_07865 [Helicobacter pylori]WRG46798.1 hypothetical protein FNE01_06925 [Helicobacter pylori]